MWSFHTINDQAGGVGWKDVGGRKIYSTFRSGRREIAEGHEAYKLAIGDNCKRKRQGSKFTNEMSTSTQHNNSENVFV